jgi:hypothetical protein
MRESHYAPLRFLSHQEAWFTQPQLSRSRNHSHSLWPGYKYLNFFLEISFSFSINIQTFKLPSLQKNYKFSTHIISSLANSKSKASKSNRLHPRQHQAPTLRYVYIPRAHFSSSMFTNLFCILKYLKFLYIYQEFQRILTGIFLRSSNKRTSSHSITKH